MSLDCHIESLQDKSCFEVRLHGPASEAHLRHRFERRAERGG